VVYDVGVLGQRHSVLPAAGISVGGTSEGGEILMWTMDIVQIALFMAAVLLLAKAVGIVHGLCL
jgi:hypothetical protein